MGIIRVRRTNSVVTHKVVHHDGVSPDLGSVQHEVWYHLGPGLEHQVAVVQGHAGEPQLAGGGVERELGVVNWASQDYFPLEKIVDL